MAASSDSREPDELDALLGRSGRESDPEHPDDLCASNDARATTKLHRKAHSIALGAGDLWRRSGGGVGSIFRGDHRKSHRKNKSSISDLIGDAMKSMDLESIAEDFRETATSVKVVWKEELEEMDQGMGSGFFDMNATRSLAIIPEDLLDLEAEARKLTSSTRLPKIEEIPKDDENQFLQEEHERIRAAEKSGSLGYNLLLLLGAVFAHSSNSTAVHMLDGVTPPMKLFWRMSASYLILLPFASQYLRLEGLPKLTLSGWMTLVSASGFLTLTSLFFYTALQYTTIGNAVIYANSQALLLIVAKIFVGDNIQVLEGFGVVIAFSGAILCSKDSEQSSAEADSRSALFGDFLALCSAAFGVAYLTLAKAVRSEMSVIFFITFVMVLGSLMVLIYLVANPSEEITFDMDPFHGIFGGFNIAHHRLVVLAYLAIVVNVGGSMGFIRAMQHFDTIIIAVGTLMEPLAASLIAFICHAGLLPGQLGWVGNMLVVVGTLGVVYPSMGKSGSGGH